MRIATANTYDASIENLQQRQAELSASQAQLTSGKRVQRASDDPTAAARAERALATIGRVEVSQRALSASKTAMALSEGALGDANDLLQQARELLVSAGNATYGDAQRASIAQQLQGIRDQLLQVANRGDSNGGHLFAGQGSAGAPFVDAPGGVQYQGAGGTQLCGSDEPMPLSLGGGSAWLPAFQTLDAAIADLKTTNRSGAQIAQTVATGLADMDQAMQGLQSFRSNIGQLLNQADNVEGRLDASKLAAQSAQSDALDLDMTQAISTFQQRQTGYDAALKTYAMVQRMSLFQYLNG